MATITAVAGRLLEEKELQLAEDADFSAGEEETVARVRQMWGVLGNLSYALNGFVGARFVFAKSAMTDINAMATFSLAAASSLLTSFGGSMQSDLLRRVVNKMSGKPNASFQSRAAWQKLGPHAWVTFGLSAAGLLRQTGLLGLLDGLPMALLFSLNTGIAAAFAVKYSGWFPSRSSRPRTWFDMLRHELGEKLMEVAHAVGWRAERPSRLQTCVARAASAIGTFLYMCGGGVWRDILGRKYPGALGYRCLVGLVFSVLCCFAMHEFGDKRDPDGKLVLTAGVPAASCMFAMVG